MSSRDLDTQLMLRVNRGDQQAFTALVERNRRLAVNLAYRFLNDRVEAEDMAQEAFVRAYQARASFRPDAGFAPWFYRILSNLCLSQVRRSKRAAEQSASANPSAVSASDTGASQPHQAAEQRELALAVRRALARLPERQRLATILHRYHGLNYDQIADAMGCSRGTVDGLLSRAKESLRGWLSEHLGEE